MHLVTTWRGRGFFAAILAVAAVGLGLVLGSAPVTEAQTPPSAAIKQVTLTPGEEVPAVTANAIGYFSGTLRQNALDFDLSAVGDDITQAHIHAGAKGSNGPVVAFLFGPADPAVGAIHPTGTITEANLVGPMAKNWKAFTDAMAKGELYVNVHSTANPAGVVRAQIPATALPTPPAPPRTGDSIAAGNGSLNMLALAGGTLIALAAGAFVLGVSKRS